MINQATRLLNRFEPLNLNGALDVLYFLGKQHDMIVFKGNVTTPDKLLQQLYSGYHPKNINIEFYGGSPIIKDYYRGSIYSFILDRIAYIIAVMGYDVAKQTLRLGYSLNEK
jgi:hypothetical protein